jgi:hypothetical protein
MIGMMQPGMMPYGMPMSPYGMGVSPYGPVYINSLSQLPPGAIPASQGMLAQALGQGQVGAQVVQPEQPSKLGSVLKFAGIGAAAGAAFGLIPFLPLGLFSGAIVGAIGGAVLGLIKGGKKPEGEFHTMQDQQAMSAAQAQAQMVASTPPGARSVVPAEAQPKRAVVMGPEMRRKWAAKVRAEKAAAAAAAAKR